MNVARAVHSMSLLSSTAYVFSEDRNNIDDLMHSHGLHPENLSTEQCSKALCFHIMTGLCATVPADCNLKRTACDDISGSSDPSALELALSHAVIDQVAPLVRIIHLRTLCCAIGISNNVRASRRSLINALQKRHEQLEVFSRDCTVSSLFDRLQRADDPTIVNIAAGGGEYVNGPVFSILAQLPKQPLLITIFCNSLTFTVIVRMSIGLCRRQPALPNLYVTLWNAIQA